MFHKGPGREPALCLISTALRAPFKLVLSSEDGSPATSFFERALSRAVPYCVAVNGVDETSFTLESAASGVLAAVSVAADRLSATLTPTADLVELTLYTVTVTTSVTDDNSLPMTTEFMSSFTTVDSESKI